MNKIDKTESVILYGFITFYFISLVVNAIKAAFGLEKLATHHWPLFAGLTLLGWVALTPAQKARAIVTFKRIFRTAAKVAQKTARTLLCYIRAVRCLPALYIKTAKEFKEVQL